MGTQHMVRVGGLWKPAIELDWITVPTASFVNGFTTQVANPLQRAVVEISGGRYQFYRGTIVLPDPLPTANTVAVNPISTIAAAFGQYHYQTVSAQTGWSGVVGRRTLWLHQATWLTWVTGGTDGAGVVVDMASIGAVRVPDA